MYEADKHFDHKLLNYQHTVFYSISIPSQTFNYATSISRDKKTQNHIALDLDKVLTLKFVRRAAPMLFESEQVQPAISPVTFTAQEAGIYFNAELTTFWNRVLSLKHCDATLKLLGDAMTYDFLANYGK